MRKRILPLSEVEPQATRRRLCGRRTACEVLGVSMSTLVRLIEEGSLPVVRLRRRVLIETADLDRLIAKSKVA